jgi:hypothetical protein
MCRVWAGVVVVGLLLAACDGEPVVSDDAGPADDAGADAGDDGLPCTSDEIGLCVDLHDLECEEQCVTTNCGDMGVCPPSYYDCIATCPRTECFAACGGLD